jgi:hypothetical protein
MKIYAALSLALIVSALSPQGVPAQDSGGCMQDAFSICGQFIPDRERVARCLYLHRASVSRPCRASLARFNPTPAR